MANRWTWEQIWNVHCEELATLMKKRKAHIARARYEEKVDHQFSSYKALGEVDSIEAELHRRCCNASLRQAFSALRNRFVFLFSMKGILWCESLYKAELSDLLHVSNKAPKDVHPFAILIMQIAISKTNNGIYKLYRRAMRCKDVLMCPFSTT